MADKRIDRSINSIISLRNLLRNICEGPGAFSDDKLLRSALKSQGGLAKYTNAALGISPTSINTLKRVSAEVLDGGFNALDELRKGALSRLDDLALKSTSSNKRNRAGLAKRVNELEATLLLLEQSNFFLSQVVTEAIGEIKSVANVDDKTARTRRSKDAIRKLLSMIYTNTVTTNTQVAKSNITPLNKKIPKDY